MGCIGLARVKKLTLLLTGRTSQSLQKNSTVVLEQTQNIGEALAEMKAVVSDFGACQTKSFDSMSQELRSVRQIQTQVISAHNVVRTTLTCLGCYRVILTSGE